MSVIQRLVAVDIARGIAIAGVVLFHLVWDLEFAGLIAGIARHPAWLAFGRCLAGAFMTLVGVSLVLAHCDRVRWRPFAKRLVVIIVAAVAVTTVTRLVFPASFVYFGILHAIAVATLMGACFVRAPASAGLVAGGLMLTLPYLLTSTTFDTRWLAWIGFAAQPPPSNDFVPIFPWVGLTLIGVSVTKWLLLVGADRRIREHTPQGLFADVLAWLGRQSLAIYLAHQPVLLALILPLSWLLQD